MKITEESLKTLVERLNELTKKEYKLEDVYTGYKLVVKKENGYDDITECLSKTDLFYQLLAMIKLLKEEKS